MNRVFNFSVLLVGIVLLYAGYRSAHSPASVFSNVIRGRPTAEATWMLIAGAIALLAGLVGIFREK